MRFSRGSFKSELVSRACFKSLFQELVSRCCFRLNLTVSQLNGGCVDAGVDAGDSQSESSTSDVQEDEDWQQVLSKSSKKVSTVCAPVICWVVQSSLLRLPCAPTWSHCCHLLLATCLPLLLPACLPGFIGTFDGRIYQRHLSTTPPHLYQPHHHTSITDTTTPTQVYWYNARTGQTQWHAPASSPCASASASSATHHADQTAPACRDLREKDEEGGGAKRPKLLQAPACQPHQDRSKHDGGKAEVFDGHSCTPPTSQHLQVCFSPPYLSLNTLDRRIRHTATQLQHKTGARHTCIRLPWRRALGGKGLLM